MAPVVTMKQLLEAGVHFGHQTRRWNPKMKRFIYGERNGIYIIDLQQTLASVEKAYTFLRDLVSNGGTVLFVGTKKQAQDAIRRAADRCGMPYINERWLGGMLTNFATISLRVQKMQEFQRMRSAGDFEAMPKKEALQLSRELEKLERNLGGIRDMGKLPDAIFVIDTKKEHIGVTEANKLRIPIVAVVDTNCDPDLIDYVIPGNDDAIRAGTLMCRIVADAVEEGRWLASRKGTGPAEGPAPQPAAPPPPPPPQPAPLPVAAPAEAPAAAEAPVAAEQSQVRHERVLESPEPAPAGAPEPGASGAEPAEPTGTGVDAAKVSPTAGADEPEQGAVPAAASDEAPQTGGVDEALPGAADAEEPPHHESTSDVPPTEPPTEPPIQEEEDQQ